MIPIPGKQSPIMTANPPAQPTGVVSEEQPARFGLVPSSMAEAMKLAEMMAAAKLVPVALQKSPADCLMVIQQAIRWDMDPFAVAQECSVISGKLMYSGKLVAAVINARGNLTRRLSYEYRGSGDSRTIIVSGQLQGESTPRVVDVILGNAKTANAMWTRQPDQQLMYHGARVWARRHTPELMLGVYSREEFDEAEKTETEVEDIPTAAPERPPLKSSPRFEELDDEAPGADEPAPDEIDFDELFADACKAAKKGKLAMDAFFKIQKAEAKVWLRDHKSEIEALYPK